MSCTCAKCAAACRHIPGLFHPLEALRAIRAGHAVDMMAVGYRPGKRVGLPWGDRFEALMPRSLPSRPVRVDPHQRNDTQDACGTCLFLTVDATCELHDSGFKPAECRRSKLCPPEQGMTDAERLDPWRTSVGRHVIQIWRKELADPAPAARRRVQQRKMNR